MVIGERDFTLRSYARILAAAKSAGYRTTAVVDWLDHPQSEGRVLVLRHDVDRSPGNALAMAELEASLGVRSSYYFRIVAVSFNPDVVKRIAELGHEIGYHYEDLARARGDADRAIAMFSDALSQLRALVPIYTMCMHGSPLAPWDNMDLWKTHSFESHGVRDCILSYDWREFGYFTDAGRTFGATAANLRDRLGAAHVYPEVRSSTDVARFLAAGRAARVMLSTHPERWTDRPEGWIMQWLRDQAANAAKLGLRMLRSGKTA